MSSRFVLFGVAHQSAIALAITVPLAFALWSRRTQAAEPKLRALFAALLLGTWAVWLILLYQRGWLHPGNLLPMHLCDWASIATIYCLLRPSQRSYELAYFWAMGGTLQALITPDLAYDFPDFRFMAFFLLHAGVVAAVLYLTIAMGLRPRLASLPRVGLWSLAYMASALLVNSLFGTNFGFLSAKPMGISLFDLLADWPWYLGQLMLIGLMSMLISYAPFFLVDQIQKRKNA